jgi:hypothetical protein
MSSRDSVGIERRSSTHSFCSAFGAKESPVSWRQSAASAHRSRAWGRYETIREQLSDCSRPDQSFLGRRTAKSPAVVVLIFALVPGSVHRMPNLSLLFHALALADCPQHSRPDRRVLDLARISGPQSQPGRSITGATMTINFASNVFSWSHLLSEFMLDDESW